MVVEDLSEDPRFADEYYVTGDLHLRFYAGAPLSTSDGYRIGTLCIYDREPRSPRADLLDDLEDLAGTAMDLLEQGQYSLSDQPQLTQTVLDHLPGIFYVVGPTGRMKRWNSTFEEVSGYVPQELDDRPALSFFAGEDRDRIERAIDRVFEIGSVQVEATFVPKSGEPVPMIFTGVQTRIGGEPRLVGMGVDISEQKRKEKQLKAAKESAEAARREADRQRERAETASASKSRFLAGVAHDLKTPVSTIRSYAQVLARRLEGEVAEFARGIDEAAAQVGEMGTSLTEIARLRGGTIDLDLDRVDTAGLLQEVHADLVPKAEAAEIDFRLDLPEASRPVWAHRGMLKRALVNLADNALTYSRAGDAAILRAVGGTADDPAGDGSQAVHLEIEDTGPGIDPDVQDELFQPFVRNAPDTDGTGLGLAVAEELVEAMEGQIEMESTPGEGTRFRIVLPAARAAG
jgi:PAS domain S-box-containing protein